jgi:hypothetical protein
MIILDDEAKKKGGGRDLSEDGASTGCEQGWVYRWSTEEKGDWRGRVTQTRLYAAVNVNEQPRRVTASSNSS